jgi:hypothetical protein
VDTPQETQLVDGSRGNTHVDGAVQAHAERLVRRMRQEADNGRVSPFEMNDRSGPDADVDVLPS